MSNSLRDSQAEPDPSILPLLAVRLDISVKDPRHHLFRHSRAVIAHANDEELTFSSRGDFHDPALWAEANRVADDIVNHGAQEIRIAPHQKLVLILREHRAQTHAAVFGVPDARLE